MSNRLSVAFRCAILVQAALALVLILGRGDGHLRFAFTPYRFPTSWYAAWALALLILAARPLALKVHWLFLGSFLSFATLIGVALGAALPVGETVDLSLAGIGRVHVDDDHWVDQIFEPNVTHGFKTKPNLSAREHHPDFDAAYHTDEEGWRVTPPSPSSVPAIAPARAHRTRARSRRWSFWGAPSLGGRG